MSGISAELEKSLGITGATDGTDIGNVGDSLKVLSADLAPATATITALDMATITLTGANSQAFYGSTATPNSSAVFALTSTSMLVVESSVIGTGGTLVVEVSGDGGVLWTRPNVFQPGTMSYSNAFTLPFIGIVGVAGKTHARVRAITSWSGSATITVHESTNTHSVIVSEALPPGTNAIGSVTVSASALPAGASTAALQTSGNATLTSIDAGIPTALGQTTASASMPVVFASDQTNIPATDTLVTAGQNRAQSVTTSAAEALGGASILTGRKLLTIRPTDGTVYWGLNSSVTTANGTPIFKNELFRISASTATHVWLISATTVNCRIAEA